MKQGSIISPQNPNNSLHNGSTRLNPKKKAKTVPSARKVMTSFSWDADGILMVDYLQKEQTINGTYYALLLGQIRENIKLKRRGELRLLPSIFVTLN